MTSGDDEGHGPRPDYRFTLANERTFLAWIRTALGLLAGGVAVSELVSDTGVAGARTVASLAALALALVLALGAYPHWRAAEQAMVDDLPLRRSRLLPVLAGGTVVLVVAAVVLVLT